MIKGFKDFLMRGNVVDLAVGIAIGVAFTTLVDSFGTSIVNPLVSVFGGSELGFGFQITDSPTTFVNLGGLVNAFIVFLVTMAVIYFAIVLPVNKLQSLRRSEDPEVAGDEETSEDIALLREIRDALTQPRP